MSLRVHNFCTKDKLSTNKYHNILMGSALFYILVSKGEEFRELAVNITKKFHYERHVSYGDFDVTKANEYNVLVDFILSNKDSLIEKWHLEEGEIEDILEGLKLYLVENFSTCSGFKRIIWIAFVVLGGLLRRIIRRNFRCQVY